jgi:hypothetical protein
LWQAGEAVRQVQVNAVKAGLPSDVNAWNASQQTIALGLARACEQERRKAKPAQA